MIFKSILTLLFIALAYCHECERTCIKGESKICMYEFHIQEYYTMGRACFNCPDNLEDCLRPECIAADGTSKPIITVNRQLPGPAIQVCEGDRIVVDVYNHQLSDVDTIHWHGQPMKDFQYYDGVPFITQCPILGAFRYDFKANEVGTSWWHSHSGLHRAEGIFGALVVRSPEEVHAELYDDDTFDHVLVLHDWIHVNSYDKFLGRHHSTLDDYASTILINGKGRNTMAASEGISEIPMAREVVTVKSGMKHRLRLINAESMNCPMVITIDGHKMTVISSDGQNSIPMTVDTLVMYSGERFDIVVEADQPIGNYWIRFSGLIDCEQNECYQGAILRYEYALEEEPSEQLFYDPAYKGTVLNPLNSVDGENELILTDMDAFEPIILEKEVDKKFYLGFDFNQINNSALFNPDLYPYNGVAEEWQMNTPQLNDISFAFPYSPPLSQPKAPQPNLCKYNESPKSCVSDYCSCTYTLEVALGDTVEIVLIDEGNIGDENHPYHLHGYHFNVVAMGKLGSHTSVAEVAALDEAGLIPRKLENPVLKDSVTIPDGGYTIIRFTADNPGWWLMHCHLTFHAEIGMVAVLHVGEPSDLPPVPEGFPTCGSFMPSL